LSYGRGLAVVVLLALLAGALGACGESGSEDPQDVLDSAGFETVESGRLDASLRIDSAEGDVDASLSGSFEAEPGGLPQLDLAVAVAGTASGKDIDFEGGLTLLGDHGFVDYRGTDYEIDPNNFAFAKSIFLPPLPGQDGGATGGGVGACRRAAAGLQVGELVEAPRNEGTADVDGVETTKVSGELDASAINDALLGLAGDPSCRVQLEALTPLPLYELRQLGDGLVGAVEKAHVDVYVGDDDVVRKLVADFAADPPGEHGRVAVELELSLSEVNEDQEIVAPTGAQPLPALFRRLGINPVQFITLGSGGEVLRLLLEKVAADAFPGFAVPGP
jgi:hypothetical protein